MIDNRRLANTMAQVLRIAAEVASDNVALAQDLDDARCELDVQRDEATERAMLGRAEVHWQQAVNALRSELEETRAELAAARRWAAWWKAAARCYRRALEVLCMAGSKEAA